MNSNKCISQHISKFGLSIILLGAALGMGVISLTLFPIVGFIIAIPLAGLAFYVFRIHLNDQCEMDFSSK